MRGRDKILPRALSDTDQAVPLFYRPVMNGKEKLVFEREFGILLRMLFGASVLVIKLNYKLVPVDPFASALPFLLCILLGMDMQEHDLDITDLLNVSKNLYSQFGKKLLCYSSRHNSSDSLSSRRSSAASVIAYTELHIEAVCRGTGGKNGILYDCIKLEAGEPVTDGIIAPSPTTCHPSPAKRLVGGRLVIEKAGHSYTPAGIRIE